MSLQLHGEKPIAEQIRFAGGSDQMLRIAPFYFVEYYQSN